MDVSAAMALGRVLLPFTFGPSSSCSVATEGLRRWASTERDRQPALVRSVEHLAGRRGGVAALLWAARWAGCGFPQVTLGHRLAASLMATRLAPEGCAEVATPWPAFLIVVPNGLVRVPHPLRAGEQVDVDHLAVFHGDGFVHLAASSRDGNVTLSVARPTLAEGLVDEYPTNEEPGDGEYPLEVVHARVLALLWRLAVGIQIELSDPSHARAMARGPDSVAAAAPPPKVRDVRLTRAVVVDCRQAIEAFVNGRRRGAPVVRTLVRGHWKHQAWGEEYRERRWIHVEPYWRGPEDGPRLVRAHRLRGDVSHAERLRA